ncbi:hypothetical protein GCM10027174_20920 [Salinifilum aidingensis]
MRCGSLRAGGPGARGTAHQRSNGPGARAGTGAVVLGRVRVGDRAGFRIAAPRGAPGWAAAALRPCAAEERADSERHRPEGKLLPGKLL